MEKPKITKEIGDAIELFIKENQFSRTEKQIKALLVAEHCCTQDWNRYEIGQFVALNNISAFELMECMVLGYEVI